jgi:hypothetical protein
MVLSGALKEFILADVFNLLTQQKITGRLVLTNDRREGGIVFKEGIIVGADSGDENLPNKLFNYLVDIKRKSPEHLNQLFSSHAGNLSVLASSLIEHKLLTPSELKSFTELCVEDICCSLLTWHQGTYRFNSLRSVATVACGVVTIPAENIIMEGMRRVDEWARMQEYIVDEMIFVSAAKKPGEGQQGEINVSAAPEEYILSLLNGSNTVRSIKKSCCLCEYKVYESISILLQSQRITALNQKYTQSIQAALKRKDAEEASVLRKTKLLLGSLASLCVAAAVIAFFVFCRTHLIPGLGANAAKSGAASAAEAPDAVQGASLLYQAITGKADGDTSALKRAGLLTERDFR